MKFKNLLFLVLSASILALTSCAKIFYSPDAETLAQKQRIIAVVPPTVSIASRKGMDGEALKEQQKTESLNFQKEIYAWLLKRTMKGKMTQEIQDIETTNAKLQQAGYPEKALTKDQLCQVLGVDGVISSNFGLTKPMSDGAAVALFLVAGAVGPTNEVNVTFSIHDCPNNKLIWNYNHKFSGGFGSSPSRIVDDLMRHASKRMPYMVR